MTKKQALRIAKSKLAEQKKWHRGAGDDVRTPGIEFWSLIVQLLKEKIESEAKK